jgi:uncharacterized protein (DUF885 family)
MPTSEFAPMAERIVDAILTTDPDVGRYAGDHRLDSELPDYSTEAVSSRVAMLRDAAAALSGVDADALEVGEQVDHAQLMSLVERYLFELTELREYEWNPLLHNPGSLLHAILARPYAPAGQRLESLLGRLRRVPDAMATARGVLRDCPRIHLETAAGQFSGTAALVRDEVPRLAAEAGATESTVDYAVAMAATALDEFAGWLREQAADGGPGRDPRIGRRLYEARLWHELDTDLTAADVLRRAWARLDEASEQLADAAASLGAESVRAALDQLAAQHPSNDSIVELARVTMAETTAFVRAFDLVSLSDDECVIQEMPEFDRGVAVAYCSAPGPLESAAVPTFYSIAPTPADWTPQRVESFYREYNNHMVRNLTVHEAMPGHFLQLAHGRRYRSTTRVPAIAMSGTFIEGWAVYAEQVMADAGFGGTGMRMQQLKMQLRTTINALLDQLVHCEGMTEADGMALMLGRGFQEEGEAAGKWRRALLTSAQLSTYFVGYTEVAAIGAARPASMSERSWHDAMLGHASPSPRHLRTLLGV